MSTRMTRRPVPYITTPAGVRISSAYQPPPARMDRDAQAIQRALLEPRTSQPLSPLARLLGAIWRAC